MPSGKKMSERVNLIIWFMLVQTIYNSYGDRSEFDNTDLLNTYSVKKTGKRRKNAHLNFIQGITRHFSVSLAEPEYSTGITPAKSL